MNRQAGIGVLLGAALVAGVLTGCSSGKGPPATVVVLPDPNSATELPNATRAVQLSVGQVLGVQVRHRDLPSRWQQVNAGDATVLKPDGEDTVAGCPAGQAGCGTTVQERYRAASAGTTTIEWDYVGMGPGTLPSGVPATPCPSYGAAAHCPIGIMKITVTVR
ncbi:MAG: hypothetical protein J2P15_13365 [Micromonosporaceae bacterium]|nr:hypothetical protein [Micromonosporaceae bacterium]